MIPHEVIHSMKNNKTKKGIFALKVDLEKAYDKLDWDFIEYTLKEDKLTLTIVEVIMACILTCNMQVL